MRNQGPLTEKEIEELDQFLLDSALEESMDISTLDGFLTAIVCGPKSIMPSEWMRWVWGMEKGEDAPEFNDQAQAQRILGLLMRHMNDIAWTLHEAPEQYEPLLMENPNGGDPIPILDEWCSGFMKGVQLDSEGWLPVTVVVNQSVIPTRSAGTSLVPAGLAKSSNSVMEPRTGCTEGNRIGARCEPPGRTRI